MTQTMQKICPDTPLTTSPEIMEFSIELITPLFGGGTTAGEVDKTLLIRATEIRGILRFWWRATRGKQFLDKKNPIATLKKREDEIWGSTDKPSPFSIVVEGISRKNNQKIPNSDGVNLNVDEWKYILFPFKLNGKKIKPDALNRIYFTLRVLDNTSGIKEELIPEVECAIWAWITFGGIGARTRRGCGALYCHNAKLLSGREDFPFKPEKFKEFQSWLMRVFKHYKITMNNSLTKTPWPVIQSVFLHEATNQMNGWLSMIKCLKEFRQGIGTGRDNSPNSTSAFPGRSRWPESESIRSRVLKTKSRPRSWKGWDSRFVGKDDKLKIEGYPRSEFGMPIIMELRHSKLPNKRKPIKVTIQHSKEEDRLASPIILRPAIIGDGECASLIIQLSTPPLDSVYLKKGDHDLENDIPINDPDKIHGSILTTYPDSPMMDRSHGSAVDAFITFIQEDPKKWVKVI
ncbi:MAG: type III-B CRISPR module RAMP protein Cmr1 [Promethearchaeota archaeon]